MLYDNSSRNCSLLLLRHVSRCCKTFDYSEVCFLQPFRPQIDWKALAENREANEKIRWEGK